MPGPGSGHEVVDSASALVVQVEENKRLHLRKRGHICREPSVFSISRARLLALGYELPN